MSANKMADIFFGKFSEIVSQKNLDNKNNIPLDNEKKVTINAAIPVGKPFETE